MTRSAFRSTQFIAPTIYQNRTMTTQNESEDVEPLCPASRDGNHRNRMLGGRPGDPAAGAGKRNHSSPQRGRPLIRRPKSLPADPRLGLAEHCGQQCVTVPIGSLAALAAFMAKNEFRLPAWSGLELLEAYSFQKRVKGMWTDVCLERWGNRQFPYELDLHAVRRGPLQSSRSWKAGTFAAVRSKVEEAMATGAPNYRRGNSASSETPAVEAEPEKHS